MSSNGCPKCGQPLAAHGDGPGQIGAAGCASVANARATALQLVVSLAMAGIAALPEKDRARGAVSMVQCLYLLGVSTEELELARTKYAQTAEVLLALRDLR